MENYEILLIKLLSCVGLYAILAMFICVVYGTLHKVCYARIKRRQTKNKEIRKSFKRAKNDKSVSDGNYVVFKTCGNTKIKFEDCIWVEDFANFLSQSKCAVNIYHVDKNKTYFDAKTKEVSIRNNARFEDCEDLYECDVKEMNKLDKTVKVPVVLGGMTPMDLLPSLEMYLATCNDAKEKYDLIEELGNYRDMTASALKANGFVNYCENAAYWVMCEHIKLLLKFGSNWVKENKYVRFDYRNVKLKYDYTVA